MTQGTLAVIVIAVIALVIVTGLVAAMRGRRGTRLRALPEESRDRYTRSWQSVEAGFIDDPRAAVNEADRVAVMVLGERGATLEDPKKMPDELRMARESASSDQGRQGTEGMRQAMVHYKRIIDDAVGLSKMRRDEGRREVAS